MSIMLLGRIKKGIPSNRQYRSLMKRMLLIGFFLPFLPMVLVGGLIYYQFDAAYKDRVKTHLMEAAGKGRQSIDHFLRDRVADLRFIVESFDFEELRETHLLEDLLRRLQMQQGPVLVGLGLVDARGNEIAGTGREKSPDVSYAESGWFREALTSGRAIGDVSTGPPGISHLIMAVRGGREGASWVLWAGIDEEAFNRLVQDVRIGETGLAFIFKEDGHCLAGPSSGFNPIRGTLRDFLGIPSKANHFTMVQRRDASGDENIYVTTPLPAADWLLVYRQKATETFSSLNKAKRITGVIVLAAGFCIGLYAWRLSQKTVRSMEAADKKKQKMNEQMFQTGKLASIGELAAGIAHEINNPVAIMVEEAGWIEDLLEDGALRGGGDLEELKRALKQIQTQGQRCKAITHKLLSFARKTDFRNQKVQIRPLIEDILAISSRRSKYDRVTIRLDVQEDLPDFILPPTELQQVLLNLMNNAMDVVEEDNGTISIAVKLEQKEIVIEVSDNGPGIPKEDLPRIFDPFFTTKPVGKGTGLGLSICYGIVKRMGGEIRVNSAPGAGTTFRVRIPAGKNGDVPSHHSREAPGLHQRPAPMIDRG